MDTTNSSVGINILAPATVYKLDVNGKIHCNGLVINGGAIISDSNAIRSQNLDNPNNYIQIRESGGIQRLTWDSTTGGWFEIMKDNVSQFGIDSNNHIFAGIYRRYDFGHTNKRYRTLYGKSLQVNGVNFADEDETTHNCNMYVNGCMMT